MYYEEYLPQDDTYDQDEYADNVTISVSSDDDSEVIVSKFNTQQKKQSDSGYYKQKILVTRTSDEGDLITEIKKVESFATNRTSGTKIRHAISGHRTPYFVGKDDLLFFSVVDTTCNEGRKLFYNNPEEYERHFHNTLKVPQEIKEQWHLRNIKQR